MKASFRTICSSALFVLATIVALPLSMQAQVVDDVDRTQGLAAPAPPGTHVLVSLAGSGALGDSQTCFVAARLVKNEGANDATFVELIVDEKLIVAESIAGLINVGVTQSNPFGVVVQGQPGLRTVTIGFPQPLAFANSLILRATVGASDIGVTQLLGHVVHGKCATPKK